jgi:peptidoglycan-associated lipoprotein
MNRTKILENLELQASVSRRGRARPQAAARVTRLGMIAIASSLYALGCGSDPKPPETADSTVATKVSKRGDTATPTSGSVQIDDKIIKLCGDIPTAHFAFDSNAITGEAATALEPLARCFSSGPGKGKSIRLIGHTDSRGETEYNLALGQRRAGSISDFLAHKGVEKARMQPSSKGEFEANGTDEAGWARDRKVVIVLAD